MELTTEIIANLEPVTYEHVRKEYRMTRDKFDEKIKLFKDQTLDEYIAHGIGDNIEVFIEDIFPDIEDEYLEMFKDATKIHNILIEKYDMMIIDTHEKNLWLIAAIEFIYDKLKSC